MTEYHEPLEELDARTRDLHRALSSLKEEVEAVDWYNQRMVRTSDEQLKRVIEHNRNEEIEHACMTLEWLRREMPEWDSALRTYLYAPGDIVGREEEVEGKGGDDKGKTRAAQGTPRGAEKGTGQGLGIGGLREGRR